MGLKKYIVQFALLETKSLLSKDSGGENDRVSILHSATWHVLSAKSVLKSLHNEQLRNNM